MTVGIVGLGLIGGSFALALRDHDALWAVEGPEDPVPAGASVRDGT